MFSISFRKHHNEKNVTICIKLFLLFAILNSCSETLFFLRSVYSQQYHPDIVTWWQRWDANVQQ